MSFTKAFVSQVSFQLRHTWDFTKAKFLLLFAHFLSFFLKIYISIWQRVDTAAILLILSDVWCCD